MNSPSIMDNTTVVDGTHSTLGDNDFHMEPSSSLLKNMNGLKPHSSSPGKYNSNVASKNLRDTADYLETERPFFVKIGKEGLISALQKLDNQLRQVGILTSFQYKSLDLIRNCSSRALDHVSCLVRLVEQHVLENVGYLLWVQRPTD